MRLTLIVPLYIYDGREAEFEEFESAAARAMKRYGGAIDRRIRCTPSADNSQPYEVHVVTFPDAQAFERYRADDELKGLADLRARAIRATTVWSGHDIPSLS